MGEKKKTATLQSLKKLVGDFRRQKDTYLNNAYKEQQLRLDFINRFFEIFGWDVSNEERAIEEFRDVVIEENLEIQGEQKNPDYTFRIGGNPVFYVETKKPSINLKQSIPSAFQVRRYGFSGKLKISILTDFEEFAIYDTSVRPRASDKADIARVFYCTFDEYEEKWDILFGLLAKENVKKGSINEFIGKAVKRGSSEVDREFLKMIDGWRTELAKNIAKNNKRLELDQLNTAVQKIIDRIIFLRICGEKEIEPFEKLKEIGESKKDVYPQLVSYFDAANRKYNSELFKPVPFISALSVDDEVLSSVISDLYYPSPYAFSVLPVEILGNIYEQFLGKTIRLTEGHQAKIEEKPEVRKAGGVYYTPKYIVDYIVQNTVGEKIKNAAPKAIEKLRILDPACGSGSFLLGAYSYLLKHHLAYYTKKDNIKKALKDGKIFQAGKNSYRLTILEKQNILLNNIYGVDIDAQAVEVTKLSLLLKLMEGESSESALLLFKVSDLKMLPNLNNNIKCGNSLIGPDFYKDKNLSLFGSEDMQKINAFDWEDKEKGFGEIMSRGGFDAVIGNPPYVTYSLGRGREKVASVDLPYLMNRWTNSFEYKINSFALFYELASTLINKEGLAAFIVPGTILINSSLGKIREYLLLNNQLLSYHKLDYQVFKDADMGDCAILFIQGKPKKGLKKILSLYSDSENSILSPMKAEISTSLVKLLPDHRLLLNAAGYRFLIPNKNLISLGTICKLYNGIKTGDNKQFLSPKKKSERYKTVIRGRDFDRYTPLRQEIFVLFDKERLWSNFDETKLSKNPKILIRQTGDRITATMDNQGCFVMDTVHIIYESEIGLKLLLAIVNSKVFNYLYKSFVPETGKTFAEVKIANISAINIPRPDVIAKLGLSKIIADKVDQMLETQKKNHSAKSESDKKHYQDKINLLDKQIDELVYELYGLTEKEIKIVEGGLK